MKLFLVEILKKYKNEAGTETTSHKFQKFTKQTASVYKEYLNNYNSV